MSAPILLLCGGPFAGRVLQWPETPPVMCFPIMRRADFKDWASETFDVVIRPSVVEYKRGSDTIIAAGHVWAYHFVGDDKYRTARTLERLVPFAAPYDIHELHDKIEVDFLLATLGMKP